MKKAVMISHLFCGLFFKIGRFTPVSILIISAFCFLPASLAAQTLVTPAATPSPLPTAGGTNNGSAEPNVDFDKEPIFQDTSERPAPPLPPLARPGIENSRILALSLNEAIRQALENNNDIEIARNDVRIAEGMLLSLQGVYDLSLNLSPRYASSVTPVTTTIGGAGTNGTIGQSGYELNSSLTKLFRPGGGQYQLFFNNARDANNSATSRLSPFYSANLGITFTQPLWRNFAIDRSRRDIKVQRRRVAESDADFRLRTIEVITEVQQGYWELVFALRDQQNRVDNVNLARQQFSDVEARVAQGVSAPLERAEVQTQLSAREAELIAATNNVTNAENTFKNLILRNAQASQWSASIVPTDAPPFEVQTISVESALTEARENRPELQRVALEQDINQIDLEFYRNQTKPRIDLVSTVATTGLAGSPANLASGGTAATPGLSGQTALISGDPAVNPNAFLLQQINQLRQAQGLAAASVPFTTLPENLTGGYGRTLENLFGGNTRNIVVGVEIELPFGNRTARGNLAVARAQTDRLAATLRQQQQLVESEVRNAVQRLESARQTVLTARTGRRSAELQVAGERQLYNEGRSPTFLVFQRENDLANSRSTELRAEADYNTALAALQRATGITLRAVNVTIADLRIK